GRLAEHDRAGALGRGYAVRIRRRPVSAIDRRAVFGHEAGRVDDVFDADRQAVQRPHDRTIVQDACALERRVRVDGGPCAERGIALADALEMRLDDGACSQLARSETSGEESRGIDYQ